MTQLLTTPLTASLLRGAVELEATGRGLLPHRLPAWARARHPDPQLLMVESQPSGVRLALRTTATVLELDVVPTKRVYVGLPPRPDGVYDLLVDGRLTAQASASGGSTLTVDLATGATRHSPGSPVTLRFDGLQPSEKDVEVWLPHDETTELVALRTDAPVSPSADRGRRTWVHHGSSISQGSNASHPTGTWPAVAASAGGVDLVNLGFGGSALLDPFVARVLRDTPADLISLEIGINLVNTDLMRRRALGPAVHGFLDTVRDGHPDVPLLVVSPLLCPMHEQTPGPTSIDPASMARGEMRFVATGDPADVAAGRLTLEVVREELARVVDQRADPGLHLLDGRRLYGAGDVDGHPLPDGLHPDADTHRVVGERFARLLFGEGGAFAPTSPSAADGAADDSGAPPRHRGSPPYRSGRSVSG